MNVLERWAARLMGAAPGDYQFSFEFGAPLGIGVAVLLLIAAAVAVVLFWRPRLAELAPGRRRALIFLRAATLVLLLFMLFDPRLVGRHVAQGEDFVLVLFDDSRSMRIAGDDGVSRGDRLLHAWQAARPDFEERLRREHQLALYRFGRVPSRLADVTDLAFDEGESDPIAAVTGAVRDLAGAHVSAVVLFSDGVRQIGDANAVPTDLEGDVPVFTVGVDTEAPWRDLELRSVSVARTNFDRSPVALTAHVVAEGLAGRDAVIEAVESDRVVASRPIRIDGDSFETRVRLEYVPQGKTWLASQVRVRLADPADDAAGTERVLENNSQGYVVDNRQKTYRILYFSGRPNWQNTFVRRAVEGDDELDIATLVRISGAQRSFEFRGGRNPYGALNNPLFEGFTEDEVNSPRYDEAVFLRIHVDEDQLTNGYPMEAEDLFPFDLVILGDIEADYFAPRHFEITRDFVAKRGGSLLMLGGPAMFSEGGYAGTIIADMLPVMLTGPRNADRSGQETLFTVRPTVEGFITGVWTLADDPDANQFVWDSLPPLYGLNLFPMLRVGAAELARARALTGTLDEAPVFAMQNYGLGRTAILATGETWQWRMQLAEEDNAHERFWRQLVRSLVSSVPRPVMLRSGVENLTEARPTRLDFLVRDELFDKREGLRASVRVTPPGGEPMDLPAEESIAEAGIYSAEFTPERTGLHVFSLKALNEGGEVVGELEQAAWVHPDLREYRDAAYDAPFLRDLAERTGGRFFQLDQLAQLADAIPRPQVTETTIEVFHLWRLPLWFALLTVFLGLEWYLRRKAGQP